MKKLMSMLVVLVLMGLFVGNAIADTAWQQGEGSVLTPGEGTEYFPEDEVDLSNVSIELTVRYEGDALVEGALVTIEATVTGVPEGINYRLQWQNDKGGEYQDVPGETKKSVTFQATQKTVSCNWRVVLRVNEEA